MKLPYRLYTTKPATPLRHSLLGFLMGTCLAGLVSFNYLITDYSKHQQLLSQSINQKIKEFEKIDQFEKELRLLRDKTKSLEESQVSRNELETVKKEFKSKLEEVHVELLDLKVKVLGGK